MDDRAIEFSRLMKQHECDTCGVIGIHCPVCGSTNKYARVSDSVVTELEGKRIRLMAYSCRACGNRYTDEEWYSRCEAPRFEFKSMKERREREKHEQEMAETIADPTRRQILLKKLFGNMPTIKESPSATGNKVLEENLQQYAEEVAETQPERVDKGPDIFELERQKHEP